MTLTADVLADLDHDVISIGLRGELTLESVPVVRRVLLKAFADSPEAVIVNLADLTVPVRSNLVVFPAAVRVHGVPAVALLLCGATPAVTSMIHGQTLADIQLYRTYREALAAVIRGQVTAPQRVSVRLAPTVHAPAIARRMAEDACTAWGVDHLCGPVALVVSELVTNAVLYAGADIDFSLALRSDYLHLNVRDTSISVPPSAADRATAATSALGGRGLNLVDVYTAAWGTRTSDTGKIIWATFRTTSVQARPGP